MIRVKRYGTIDKILSRLPLLKVIPVCDSRTRVKVTIGGIKKLDIVSMNETQAFENAKYIYFMFMPRNTLKASTYNMKTSEWKFRVKADRKQLKETRTVYV